MKNVWRKGQIDGCIGSNFDGTTFFSWGKPKLGSYSCQNGKVLWSCVVIHNPKTHIRVKLQRR